METKKKQKKTTSYRLFKSTDIFYGTHKCNRTYYGRMGTYNIILLHQVDRERPRTFLRTTGSRTYMRAFQQPIDMNSSQNSSRTYFIYLPYTVVISSSIIIIFIRYYNYFAFWHIRTYRPLDRRRRRHAHALYLYQCYIDTSKSSILPSPSPRIVDLYSRVYPVARGEQPVIRK